MSGFQEGLFLGIKHSEQNVCEAHLPSRPEGRIRALGFLIQWTLAYPATMGPDQCHISEIAGYVNTVLIVTHYMPAIGLASI